MSSDHPLAGTSALVTGASSGIGREAARALARDGASVAVAARRAGRLDELADELEREFGADALAVPTDVTEEAEVERMVEATVDAFGGLDVAVSNAGVGGPGSFEEVTTEQYRRLMAVNTDGMFFTARAALPHLRDSAGVLVFVASFAGKYPRPGNEVYAATKWWTRGLALSLAGNVGREDVAVTLVNPAEVRTEIGGGEKPSMKERYPEGSISEPGEVADAIAFAARQEPPTATTEIDVFRRDKFEDF